MNLYELIMELVDQNVPVDPKRFNGLKDKARMWYFRVVNNEPHPDGEGNPPEFVANWIRKYGELWYVQIAFAIAYIPLNRWIDGFVNPGGPDEVEQGV